ncbi:MAG: hypothetical protein WBB19_18640 [Desulforhopalus sp.]
MKKDTIISEAELSHEELKCLEAHFRQVRNNAVVDILKQAPLDTAHLLRRIFAKPSEDSETLPSSQ